MTTTEKQKKTKTKSKKSFNYKRLQRELITYGKLFLSFMLVAWIVVTITFILIHSLPGSAISGNLDDVQKEVQIKKYGLDKPLIIQYFIFIGGIFTGDLGMSTSVMPGEAINSFLWMRMGISFQIGIISLLIGVSVGIILGILIGIKPGGWVDNIGTIIISLGIAIPSFVLGLLLMLFGKAVGMPYVFDKRDFASVILPAIAMSIGTIITYMRYLRVEMNQQLSSQHYKFAAVKGVSRKRFIFMHALKPALFPVISFLPSAILGSFIGSMFVEGIFGVPGAGSLMLDAINSKDFNIVQALVIIYTFMTVLSFFFRDIIYRLLDPRVRR